MGGVEYSISFINSLNVIIVAVYRALAKWGYMSLLLTSGNTVYTMSFLEVFSPFLSLPLYYDVNRMGRSKAMTYISPFSCGTKHS